MHMRRTQLRRPLRLNCGSAAAPLRGTAVVRLRLRCGSPRFGSRLGFGFGSLCAGGGAALVESRSCVEASRRAKDGDRQEDELPNAPRATCRRRDRQTES